MILTGEEIKKQVEAGRIKISDFDPDQCTTNSYDLRLGDKLVYYLDEVIDTRKPARCAEIPIPPSGFQMNSGDFYLAHTLEEFGSDHFVPIIHAKSGVARAGLFVHVTADLIDIGWHGHSTLQLHSTLPTIIFPEQLIAQVSFWVPKGDIKLYKGKYMSTKSPMPSLIYQDHAEETQEK